MEGHSGPPPTFQAADPPKSRMGEAAGVLLLRGAAAPSVGRPVVAGRQVGGVADESARVQPVVGADGNGHEAEGGEGAHGCQQYLHPFLTPQAPLFVPALQRLQFDHGQPGGRGPPPGQRGRGRAGGWGGHSAGRSRGAWAQWGWGGGARTRLGRQGSEGSHGHQLVEGRQQQKELDQEAPVPSPASLGPPLQKEPHYFLG